LAKSVQKKKKKKKGQNMMAIEKIKEKYSICDIVGL
jgi:hypothetical protein